jgi:hypothetical protein
MANAVPRRCKDCNFGFRLFDYQAESYLLFCDNVNQKDPNHPIGFLNQDAVECEYFESPRRDATRSPE